MKRIQYLLLACLTLAAVVSCGDADSGNTDVTTTADSATEAVTETETEASLLDGLGEKDLGGMVYTIFDCNSVPGLL